MPKTLDDYGGLAGCTVCMPCERALFAERCSISSALVGGLQIAEGES